MNTNIKTNYDVVTDTWGKILNYRLNYIECGEKLIIRFYEIKYS